jgi:Spy/CpxP family protein refolding chaperone
MSSKLKMMLLLILGLGALLLASGLVSAGPGTQSAPYAEGGGCAYGYGGCGGGGCAGGYDTGLSTAQTAEIQREKEAFYNATRPLRDAIVEKQRALAGELAKQSPDAGRAGELQNELNDLKSKFNQHYLQYMLAMRKIVPDYGVTAQQPDTGGAQPSCCSGQ